MNAFVAHTVYDFRSAFRNPSQLLMNYLFPIGVYLILGLIMTQINPLFAKSMVPAMILLAGMASFLLGLPGPLVEAREAGVFRSYKINGVPAFSILFIPVLTTVFHFLIACILILLTAAPLFHGELPTNWGPFALVTLLAALGYGSLGALIGVISGNSRVTVMLTQLIFLPSMLLGGLMVPLSMLPASIRGIAYILPTTHLMQAFLGAGYGEATGESFTTAIIVLAASSALSLGLAARLFSWDKQGDSRRVSPAAAIVSLAPFIVSAFFLK